MVVGANGLRLVGQLIFQQLTKVTYTQRRRGSSEIHDWRVSGWLVSCFGC